jgi:hypothetical protein
MHEEPAMKKNANRAAKTQKPAARKPSTRRKTGNASQAAMDVSPEQRWRMIAEAAYLRAEKRGFVDGDPVEDWLQAEAEITTLLAET